MLTAIRCLPPQHRTAGDDCKAACAAEGSCKAIECKASSKPQNCELWTSVPMYGGGNPPYECWIKQ